ncbi:MAG TPA: cytochrome b [Nostocaceae cyanobacterium]|nr:cytochrome b [Nostocaceae cyanobacterium]
MTASTQAKPRRNSAFQHLMSVHWWMAGFYLVLFMTGVLMPRLPDELVIVGPLYDLHKSIGALVLGLLTWRILVLLRVWWRKYTKKFPKFSPQWLKVVALHTVLYLFMWAVPVSGFFLSNSYKSNNVKFFGLTLPDIFPQNSEVLELARSMHFWTAYIFLAFVVLHIIDQWKVTKALWRRFTKATSRLKQSSAK